MTRTSSDNTSAYRDGSIGWNSRTAGVANTTSEPGPEFDTGTGDTPDPGSAVDGPATRVTGAMKPLGSFEGEPGWNHGRPTVPVTAGFFCLG